MSQFRKNLKYTLKNHLRWFYHRRRLGFIGKRVFIDTNVELLRFPKNIKILDNAVIKEGARICSCNETSKISIGKKTTVGYHTFIFASAGINIGDNCLIAPFVYIVDSDHGIAKDILINKQSNITEKISIGNDVWIGTGAKILKGVSIGDGAVVAAGSVVKDDIGSYEIFGGIPAKKISERK